MRTCLLLVLGLLAACEVTTSQRATAACTSLCECEAAPLPAVQDRCVAECVQEVERDLSDECLACISGNDSCATLERECEPICDPPRPDFVDSP